MQIKHLTPLLWIALFLGLVELPLEYRAQQRGWYSPLFGEAGRNDRPAESTDPDADPRDFGPAPEYPFWSPIYPPEHNAVPRLWLASASHAAETQLPVRVAFPSVLDGLCLKRERVVQVLNASHPGFLIAHNVHQVETLGPRFSPSVALLYQMSNDLTNLVRSYYGSGKISEDEPAAGAPPDVLPGWTTRFVERATLFTVIKRNLTSRLVNQRVLVENLPEPLADAYTRRVRRWIHAARAAGATPYLMTFATSHSAAELDEFPTASALVLFSFNIYLSPLGWMNSASALNERIRALGREEQVPVVDLAAAMRGRPQLFRDFVHFTPEGHQRVARVLADVFCPPG